jgi:hypothetical protein
MWRAATFGSLCVFEQRRHVGPQAAPVFPPRRRRHLGDRPFVEDTDGGNLPSFLW